MQRQDWVSIKIKFLNSEYTLKHFAEIYNLNYETVRKYAANGKWLKEREKLQEEGIEIKGGKQVIKQMCRLLLLVKEALMAIEDNDNYFYTNDGMPNLGVINKFLVTYKELEKLVRSSFDVMPPEIQKQIEISIERLELKKRELGEEEDTAIDDNFLEALNGVDEELWSQIGVEKPNNKQQHNDNAGKGQL